MLKIAYCAGHYIGTPGKRVPAALDKAQTREWTLNDRVARYFNQAALEYEGVQTLRTDDSTGKKKVTIAQRTKKANDWGADLYIDMHHNAGVNLGKGGGVVAYSNPGSAEGKKYRDAIYEAVIAAGGLKGNRANPLREKAYDSLRLTNMPAVLMEYGFMDSRTDYPVISQESYAKLVGYATMEGIAKVAGLKKLPPAQKPAAQPKDQVYTKEQFIRDVQKAIGAKVDGIPGSETLGKTPTISAKKNSTHAVVKPIQKRLAALGYADVGAADGIAGKKFTKAVKAFQKNNGCRRDGEVTAKKKTWKKLLEMI